jgi:FkbM family methyltransferase
MMKRLAKSMIPKTAWTKLSGMRAAAEVAIDRGGLQAAITLLGSPFLNRLSKFVPGRPRRIRRLRIKGYRFPIHYRIGTSDLNVIEDVLIRGGYECVAHEQDVSLIIDCGANIGCTSFFLLHRYSHARVIVVEPDPDNFALCQRNLEPFGDRVELVHSAVWPTVMPLRVVRGAYRDGREWAFQVRPISEGEPCDLMATTVFDLIEGSGSKNVDLLKIDIEAAEIPLFSKNTEKWLPQTRCLVIELHGADCERVFFKALAEYNSEFEKSGELTICRNIGRSDLLN